MDAIIRKEYGRDPEIMERDEWCKLYAEWQFLNRLRHENQKAVLLDAAAEILNAISPTDGRTNNAMDT